MNFVLQWLYPIGIYFHFVRSRQYFILVPLLMLILAFFRSPWRRQAYGLYLGLTSAIFFYDWPDVANHVLIILVVNLALIWTTFRKKKDEDESLRWFLIWLLGIVYFWAGFHKLNFDFLYTLQSCAHEFSQKIWPDLYSLMPAYFLKILPWLTIAIEIFGGLLLLVPHTRKISLFLLFYLHISLASVGFADFSMLALSLLFYALVLPSNSATIQLTRLSQRYFVAALLAGLLGVGMVAFPLWGLSPWQDALLSLTISMGIIMLGTYLIRNPSSMGLSMNRQNVFCNPPSRFLALVLGIVFIWGGTSYLGLGTRTNFSMFSNLQTEKGFSNHILIKEDSLKVFSLQEKIFWFKSVNLPNGLWSFPRPYKKGEGLNAVELRKLLKRIRKDYPFPFGAEYQYQGQNYITKDLFSDPRVEFDKFHIEDYMFGFKFVPMSSPYRCQW